MEALGYIQEFVAGLIYLAVGVRLYLLNRRTNRLPELLLSLSYVFWGSNYFLYNIPWLVLEESTAVPLYFVARLALDLGTFLFVIFIWKVFRSGDRRGAWLVAGVAALLLAGIGGSIWVKDWEGMLPISNPWFWPNWLATGLAPAWMAAEGFYHFQRSRQRQRLGLCDAMTCHRFLLWGIAGTLWVLLQFALIYQYLEYEITQGWGGPIGVVVGFFEVVPVALTWLVFYPPASYRAWVERRYAAA
jgi:hypothetical protein